MVAHRNLLYLSVVLIGVESAECLGAPDGGHAVAVQDSQPDAEEDQDRSWREGYRHQPISAAPFELRWSGKLPRWLRGWSVPMAEENL